MSQDIHINFLCQTMLVFVLKCQSRHFKKLIKIKQLLPMSVSLSIVCLILLISSPADKCALMHTVLNTTPGLMSPPHISVCKKKKKKGNSHKWYKNMLMISIWEETQNTCWCINVCIIVSVCKSTQNLKYISLLFLHYF